MKGRAIRMMVVGVVGALMLSSALLAGQPAQGRSGVSSPTPDTTTWSGKWSNSPDSASLSTNPGHDGLVVHENSQGRGNGLVDAILKKLRSLADTTTWGFGPPIR